MQNNFVNLFGVPYYTENNKKNTVVNYALLQGNEAKLLKTSENPENRSLRTIMRDINFVNGNIRDFSHQTPRITDFIRRGACEIEFTLLDRSKET